MSEEGVRSPETRVAGSCELPCECWEPTQVLCKSSKALLTAEPFLHPFFGKPLKGSIYWKGYFSFPPVITDLSLCA